MAYGEVQYCTLNSTRLGYNYYYEMNAQHCGASLIEYMCRTWNSYMHMTVIRM